MTALRLLTIGMAASLAYNTSLTGPAALGVVVVANRVHINSSAATVGAKVYDGDRFQLRQEACCPYAATRQCCD